LRRGRLLAVHDIVEFLRTREPFAELDERALEQLATRTEVEFFSAREVIFRQGEPTLRHVRIIRRGSVELVDRGRVLDLLGEGEWFGHPAMLTGLPTGWAARAAEDTLCYRLAADDVVPLLTRPTALRFVARSLMARPRPAMSSEPKDMTARPDLPARALIHEQLVTCAPDTPIREAARRMADGRASCALVTLGSGELGILTDHDLRVRVVAEGMPLDAPVSSVMSAPAVTAGPDELGSELTLTMIDRGVRHLPVLSEWGAVVGVVTDVDLLAAAARTPLIIRRAIEDARDLDELRQAAGRLLPSVVDLHDGGAGARQISAIMAAVMDAVARRLVELRLPDEALPPFAWLSLGSYGRREPAPSSDIDSGLAWQGETSPRLATLAQAVVEDLEQAGFTADPHGANAASPLFARSASDWRTTIAHWLEHPGEEKVLIAMSLLVDGRTVAGHGPPPEVLAILAEGRHHPPLLRLLQRLALAHRPPTAFLREIVVEHGGSHRGHFNIKRGGLLPIVNIARYAGMAAGTTSTSTRERLRAASAASILRDEAASALDEAFDLFTELRLEHQVEQLRAAKEPDDFVDPGSLNALTRRYVREAFRVVTAVQRALSSELVYR
jgi:CBS domain-containing protein